MDGPGLCNSKKLNPLFKKEGGGEQDTRKRLRQSRDGHASVISAADRLPQPQAKRDYETAKIGKSSDRDRAKRKAGFREKRLTIRCR